MPSLKIWVNDRPLEAIVLICIIALVWSAIERMRTPGTNRHLLVANWSAVTALSLSLQPVYQFIDPLLGGVNITNLLAHLAVCFAGFSVTFSLARTAASFFKEQSPGVARPMWLVVSALGLVLTFILMGAYQGTNRGLVGYSDSYLAYTTYQCLTLSGLFIGAPYLLPRLLQMASKAGEITLKLQLRIFFASYISAILAAIFFVLTPISEAIINLREACIYTTFLLLTVAFMVAAKERKKSISSKDKQQLKGYQRHYQA